MIQQILSIALGSTIGSIIGVIIGNIIVYCVQNEIFKKEI